MRSLFKRIAFIYFLKDKDPIPRGYGFVRWDYDRANALVVLIPFNLLCRAWIWVRDWVRLGNPPRNGIPSLDTQALRECTQTVRTLVECLEPMVGLMREQLSKGVSTIAATTALDEKELTQLEEVCKNLNSETA